MLKKMVISLVVTGLVAMSANAHAAMMAYLYAKGQKTGPVKGSITQKGREGAIGVIAFEQASKIDAGRLSVGQVVFTKEVDKASPILRQMLDSQEIIAEATIQFWTPQLAAAAGVGSEVQYYTVRLTNARLTSMKTVMANIRHPEEQKLAIYEELALSYDRADWTWTNGGITTAEMGGNAPK